MLDCDFNGRITWAEQEFSHFGVGLALHRVAINRKNAVAKSQAGARGWRIREGGANVSVYVGAFAHVLNGGSDSEVLRPLFSAEGGVFNRIEIGRVRIQDAQHPGDRGFEDSVVVELTSVNMVRLNDGEGFGEVALNHRRRDRRRIRLTVRSGGVRGALGSGRRPPGRPVLLTNNECWDRQ